MSLAKTTIILTAIIVFASFLRFFQLGQNPPSLTWDEAAWGYNAYSLGIDGRDEFGRFLPLNYLESFGDFKPPAYAYLDVIPIKLFGLTEFATRFPSAFFGVLTVLMAYFLTKRIFWNSKSKEQYALFTSLFLAISSWHIMLSRAAFEANVATFFLVGGVWLFLTGVQEKKWHIIFSAIFFALSIYTFNTARMVAPILVLFLGFAFRKKLIENKRQTLIAVLMGILLMLPILGFLFSPQAGLRFKEVNIFTDVEVVKTSNQEIINDSSAWSRIMHNRRVGYALSYLKHYFDNLNPSFLFIKGDGNPKFSTQDVGQMYIWDLPFFIAGILFLIKRKEGSWWIIPAWLIIGIIPAATARETPHALRIETTLPTFQIITAIGATEFVMWISKIKNKIAKIQIKYLIFAVCFLFLIFNFLYYIRGYYVHYPYEFSGEWQYGYKDSIEYVKSVGEDFDNIYVTNAMGRPYIYYLFYTKTDPRIFRKNNAIRRDVFGFVTVDRFGKYNFLNGVTEVDNRKGSKNLFIQTPNNVPRKANILKTFNLLNGTAALVVYE